MSGLIGEDGQGTRGTESDAGRRVNWRYKKTRMGNLSRGPSLPSRFSYVVTSSSYHLFSRLSFLRPCVSPPFCFRIGRIRFMQIGYVLSVLLVCRRKKRSLAILFLHATPIFFLTRIASRTEFVECPRVGLHDSDEELRIKDAERTAVGARFGEAIQFVRAAQRRV